MASSPMPLGDWLQADDADQSSEDCQLSGFDAALLAEDCSQETLANLGGEANGRSLSNRSSWSCCVGNWKPVSINGLRTNGEMVRGGS